MDAGGLRKSEETQVELEWRGLRICQGGFHGAAVAIRFGAIWRGAFSLDMLIDFDVSAPGPRAGADLGPAGKLPDRTIHIPNRLDVSKFVAETHPGISRAREADFKRGWIPRRCGDRWFSERTQVIRPNTPTAIRVSDSSGLWQRRSQNPSSFLQQAMSVSTSHLKP